MPDYVKAVSGDRITVVELAEGVYALVNGERYMFSRNPGSFYKQGYFEAPPEKIRSRRLKTVVNTIRKALSEMTEENYWEMRLGNLSLEEIKNACASFLKRFK